MGGKEARGGFWFQDAKALTRLLDDAIQRRWRQVLGLALAPELRVRIESAVELVVEESEVNGAAVVARPIWDGTFTVGTRVVVDECKLGGPDRNDRVTFYRRLRATVASGVAVATLVPRFTVGRGSVEHPNRWTDLGAQAQTATVPAEPPARVDSPQKGAAEALYYLTTPQPIWKLKKSGADDGESDNVPATRPLSVNEARALLARFEIDAQSTIDDLDTEIGRQLEALGAELAIDELVDLLGGWIARIARSTTWQADLTADSLNANLTLVARYLTVPPAIEELWHRLRMTTPAAPNTMIADQPWREVQPQVEVVVGDRAANNRVVFTSEGGIGKSHLLAKLYGESASTLVWIDAVADLRDVENAVALGVWANAQRGAAVTVFVDAIDQAADPAGLLAGLERALAGYDGGAIYVAMRFATWAGMRDRLPRWRDVRLTRWSNDRIRLLADAGRREPLSSDLVDLLRTPLLLDLFLRTFAAGDPVPEGLATRHGVLRAYFERRVYSDNEAPARRAVLDAGIDAVLANTPEWRSADPAARTLSSEGVVVNVFGALRFRHALLRDFSAALQLIPRSAREIANSLRGVESPIVRNELLRGTLEALLDPSPIVQGAQLADLVHECTDAGLAPGIALGTTDAPTASLLAAVAALENGGVLRQALGHARLIESRAWLRTPAALGAARPDWLGEAQFHGLASLAELALATGDTASEALAATLRSWTLGRAVGTEEGWSAATIASLLVRVLPDDATADWFARLPFGASGFRSRFLEEVRNLGSSADVSDVALSRALDNVVFGEGSHVLDGGYSLWELTHLCLSDHDGNPGLLNTRPYVALAMMFALSVEEQLRDDRRRAERVLSPALLEMFGNIERPQDFADAEARLRVTPTMTEAESLGSLVDDSRSTDGRAHDYLSSLLDEVEQRATEEPPFAEHLAAAALGSRSVHARIMVLSLTHPGSVAQAIDEILRDPRAYHVLYASGALWDAIRARWPSLSAADRNTIQQNILARARSPRLSFTSVGRLASAIPRDELAADLQPYLEFLETTGRSTAPPRPARIEMFSGGPDDDYGDEAPRAPEMVRLEQLAKTENDDEVTNQAIALLEEQLSTLGNETPDTTWYAISRVIQRDERREAHSFAEASARTLFEAALGSIAPRRPNADRWVTLLDIADACPSYVPAAEALVMRTRLIAEVVQGAGEHAENEEHVWRALAFVRPIAWFSDGTGGRAVFERWFRQHLRGDGMQAGERFLQFLTGRERLELVSHVLQAEGRFHGTEGLAFMDDAGEMFAAWSLWWDEAFARDQFHALSAAERRPGYLASAEAWRWFLGGFGWSLQNEVRHAAPNPRAQAALARIVPLFELAWTAWRIVVDETAEQNNSMGWAVTALLGAEFETKLDPPVGGWAAALRGLLARVIQDGGRNDIGAFQQVDWTSVDQATLCAIADAAIARSEHEIARRPATDWMIGSLTEILVRVGTRPALALVDARRVLDCLQRIGRSASRAVSAALAVERSVREREAAASG